MAFQKKIWKGRKSEYPSCRKLIKADGSAELVTLARAEGQVTEEGDAFSPENMNGLEDRIEAGFAELKTVAPSETTPKAAGTAATGTEETFARGDHVHPKQTSVTGNAGTATKLATARTIDGVSFNGSAAITHYGTCSTAAATAAKVVACTGFTLVTGATIRVKFTVANSAASPTLNVNSTGAKAIYYRGAAITAGYLAANRTYEFVYNGTQYELVGDINTDTNTTYTAASAAPKAAGTAAVGTSTKYAREDHVHPLQSSVTGNAGTATKLATARNINDTPFDGKSDIRLKNCYSFVMSSPSVPNNYYYPFAKIAAGTVNLGGTVILTEIASKNSDGHTRGAYFISFHVNGATDSNPAVRLNVNELIHPLATTAPHKIGYWIVDGEVYLGVKGGYFEQFMYATVIDTYGSPAKNLTVGGIPYVTSIPSGSSFISANMDNGIVISESSRKNITIGANGITRIEWGDFYMPHESYVVVGCRMSWGGSSYPAYWYGGVDNKKHSILYYNNTTNILNFSDAQVTLYTQGCK